MHHNERNRLRVIAALVITVGVLFVIRLYMLQVVHGDDFRKEADAQYVSTVPNLYDRGNIYFREKGGKLVAGAMVNSGYVVAINPKLIIDKEASYRELASIITLDKEGYMASAQKQEDPYEEVADHISEQLAQEIQKKKIPGVSVYREAWRYYPADSLAAQVLGFVGYNGKELSGRYGLESYYNDTLLRNQKNLYVNFFAELFSDISGTLFDRTEEASGDLVLTIEPTVQSYLEGELRGVMDDWRSDLAGGIIMDPKTGAIYAMASVPTFNLNEYGKVKNQNIFVNPAVQNVYEMGSIVKPLTMAAGLDAGVITEHTTYNDTGHVTLNNKTIGNHDGRGRGPGTPMQRVLNDSLNTGVVFVETKLGNKLFADYMLNKFHMGEETGIDLPGERQGLMSNLSAREDVEYATAAFGQGIAVSPINMVAALATLGNGGKTVSPHVVDEIDFVSGKVKHISPIPAEQELKPGTSERVTRMLVNVVDQALLGGTVKIPEYSIAAKTGTAQIADPSTGKYYDDRFVHTFFGYFPAYDPKFIIFLYTYYPKNGATFASHTLTMPFMRTAKFLLHYYDIPPDRAVSTPLTLLDR